MAYVAQMTPVDQINAALRGSVIDTLRLFIPSLAPYSNDEAFNVILNSPEMTQRSFRAFRDHPDAFADMLRGPENQPVAGDNEPLSCGRTLTQVVALVVQAVAKRYFRAKLSLRRQAAPAAEPGLMEKVSRLFSSPPPRKPEARKAPSQADRLFLAMRDYLLFEWQLRLIPHYVGLPVPLVQKLGSRLLEFREIEDIQWMVRTGQPLSAPTVRASEALAPLHIKADLGPMPIAPIAVPEAPTEPAPMDMAPQPLVEDQPDLTPLSVPDGVSPQRFVAAVLGKVNPPLARWLAKEMSLNPRQLAVMMLRAYEALPAGDFQRFGSCAPSSEEGRRFLAAARSARFGVDTSPGKTAEFARLYQAKVKSLMQG